MKIRKANKKNERHIVRRFGVEQVRQLFGVEQVRQLRSVFPTSEDSPCFRTTYYYGVGYGRLAIVECMVYAQDEMGAYTKVINMLRDKKITTRKANKRGERRRYRKMVRSRRNRELWSDTLMDYLSDFKQNASALVVG